MKNSRVTKEMEMSSFAEAMGDDEWCPIDSSGQAATGAK